MSNVLTIEEKKRIGSRLFARYLFVGAAMLTLGAIVASLALAPALASVVIARASVGASLASESAGERDDGAQALRAQTLVDALTPLLATAATPSERVAQALAFAPEGISITAIAYQPGSVQLSGLSSGREAANEFRSRLEESGLFANVTVPVTALVSAGQGSFMITLTDEQL